MIWIRADANEAIGTGHVMRCLSIAAALKKAGEQVCFLVADEKAVKLLRSRGQEYIVLHTAYNEMMQELDDLHVLTDAARPSAILVDSYFATDEYLEKLKDRLPVAYMDDLGRKKLPVDLVINYNIYADRELYQAPREDAHPRYCLGMEYAPLREEFRDVGYSVKKEAGRVLVTTGGADKYNIAGKFVEKALAHPVTGKLEYWVVSGAMNSHWEALVELKKQHPNVQVFQNVSDMCSLMQQCDMAFSAGGSTLYELASVGVPLLCISFVENQQRQVEAFGKRNLACWTGDYMAEGDAMAEGAVDRLAQLAGEQNARIQYSRVLRELVDGRGAERIAAALKQLGAKQ